MSEASPSRHVAIVGAGPAAIYGAGKLAKAGHHVTLINRDIKPGGLAEYGIYPNKYKMKRGLRTMFDRILSDKRISYVGHVTVGAQGTLSLDELRACGFDAVIVAVGAQGTKWLGLPGEEGEGVYHAKDLVYHYNTLPPFSTGEFAIGHDVAVVGFGNVALDIVHWLVCDKKVGAVTLIARRGPAERASTPKELKLVSQAIDVEQVDAEIESISGNLTSLGQDIEEVRADLLRFVDVPLETESDTALRMRFLRSPARIAQSDDGQVRGLVCEVTRMTPPRQEGGRPGVESTGEFDEIMCDTVVFAIGDSIEPAIGLPLDAKNPSSFAVCPTPWEGNPEAPRYMVWDRERERPMWGTFVIGWARRASDGLVGKARADAEIGCEEILAYLRGDLGPGEFLDTSAQAQENLYRLLDTRGIEWVDLAGVKKIEEVEKREAQTRDVPEFKLGSNEAMLEIARS